VLTICHFVRFATAKTKNKNCNFAVNFVSKKCNTFVYKKCNTPAKMQNIFIA
jgi:hypothetical protein